MSKNNKTAILRTYLVLSICWSSWWLYRYFDMYDGIMQDTIIINSLAPIPLYFGLRWILNSFKD